MISIIALWLPILVSALVVFVVSSMMHMLFTHHNSDFKKVPSEDKVMDDLRTSKIPPGDYMLPYTVDNKERNSQEFKDKIARGPVAIMTILPPGSMNMTSNLIQWFVYLIIVGIFAAYIGGRALTTEADYLQVFRFIGATSFIGYSLALMQESIWFGKNWTATLKSMFDGLIYALLTAGVFGWLWP